MPSNYTLKEVEKLIDVYTNNPCMETVESLMTLLNRSKKSIIGKLVKEGVYVTRGYRTKGGDVPITKLEIVRSIEDALDISLPGLDKTPKNTLQNLATTLIEHNDTLEESLAALQDAVEQQKVLNQMLGIKKKSSDTYDPIAVLGEDT